MAGQAAARALLVGLSLALIAQTVVVFLVVGKVDMPQAIGLPIFALLQLVNILFFAVVLFLLVRLVRIPLALREVAIIVAYTFAGLLPLLLPLMAEQLFVAVQLLQRYRDPSLPYLTSAGWQMLFPSDAQPMAIVRAWVSFAAQITIVIAFLLVGLPSNIAKAANIGNQQKRPIWTLIVSAFVLVTITLDTLMVRFVLGRVYWMLVGKLV